MSLGTVPRPSPDGEEVEWLKRRDKGEAIGEAGLMWPPPPPPPPLGDGVVGVRTVLLGELTRGGRTPTPPPPPPPPALDPPALCLEDDMLA